MSETRVIIVHTLEHCLTALDTAEKLKVRVTLQSAMDAIHYAGALYLKHMFDQAREQSPKAEVCFILDCANSGAEAIEAIRAGHTHLRSSALPEIREKLADIAEQSGVVLYNGEYESLDLNFASDTKSACEKWLKK